MKAGFDFRRREAGHFKDLGIRHEIDLGPRLFCFAEDREKPVLQLYDRLSSFIVIVVNGSVFFYDI